MKRNMKQGVLILFMLTCFLMENRLFAQDFKNEEVRKLLISAGELEQEDKCSYYAYEIETSNMMTSLDTCGVYRIGAHVSESYEHILLLDKQKTIFIDCHKKDLAQALKLLFSFFGVPDVNHLRCILHEYHTLLFIVYTKSEKEQDGLSMTGRS